MTTKVYKNSFRCGIKVVTPTAIPNLFPCVGERIKGIKNKTEHYMPPCQWHDDATCEIDGGKVYINDKYRCDIPIGSIVETVYCKD